MPSEDGGVGSVFFKSGEGRVKDGTIHKGGLGGEEGKETPC